MARSRVAKWPDIGATTSTLGRFASAPVLNRSSVAKGVVRTASSVIGISALPTSTGASAKAGRTEVTPRSAKVASCPASERIGAPEAPGQGRDSMVARTDADGRRMPSKAD